MRCVFYVAVAVAVLARSSVVAAFTNADEFKLLSKTTPDFAADATISSDSRKRFLRVTDPEDGPAEERVKIGSLEKIIAKLDEQKMNEVARILDNVKIIHAKSVLKAAHKQGKITSEDFNAAKIILGLSK